MVLASKSYLLPQPREPLGLYSSVWKSVPDSAAVQITTAGTGGGASLPHGGADPVMSKGSSSPPMVIAVDWASLQVNLDGPVGGQRKMCSPSTAPWPSVSFKLPSWVLIRVPHRQAPLAPPVGLLGDNETSSPIPRAGAVGKVIVP